MKYFSDEERHEGRLKSLKKYNDSHKGVTINKPYKCDLCNVVVKNKSCHKKTKMHMSRI